MDRFRFPAYIQLGNNRYRERYGLDFEDFKVGQIFRHRPGVTISQQDNVEECINTFNQAMIHFDAHYAEQTEFKRPLVDTTLIIQRLMGLTWKTYYRRKRIVEWSCIDMLAPVFGGDTLYVETEVLFVGANLKDSESGLIEVSLRSFNQNQKKTCEMRCSMLIYKRDHLPFSAKNY
ncbi:MaoC family dehydratase [Microbulbifer variabilis]|uniref:MaoC family dehydratase n=1 Tax=Microbulbifer variabilis TaxID=266805 RepID=UPI001CFF3572|nr:MaoC family dehydratase [Microbulbifer variabilis]